MEISGREQVEREISEYIAVNDWRKVIDLGQALPYDERVKYLWLWPLQKDLERIQKSLTDLNITQVVSVGCGSGLLEWLITAATGINVAGVEKDEKWWRSKYARKTFIPMVFAEARSNMTDCQGQLPWHAMMFCYFNAGVAFREYVKNFTGNYVIIVGPREGKGVHTDPLPFDPVFPSDQRWKRVLVFRVGSEDINYFVIYRKQ